MGWATTVLSQKTAAPFVPKAMYQYFRGGGEHFAPTGNAKPTIGIAGGRIQIPGFDTGNGHWQPAEALYEALLAHPDVQSGRVNIQRFMQDKGKFVHPIEHASPDLTVQHGFSGLYGDSYVRPEEEVGFGILHRKADPARFIPFPADIPGPPPQSFINKMWPGALANPRRAVDLIHSQTHPNAIRYGQNIGDIPSFWSGKVHPLLGDAGINAAQKAVSDTRPAEAVYTDIAKKYMVPGKNYNPDAAAHIMNSIADAKAKGVPFQPITITGSGRGDYVGSRAWGLNKEVGGNPQHPILAFGGRSTELDKPLYDQAGVSSMGPLPLNDYVAARAKAHANMGSTGGSEYSESLLLPSSSHFLAAPNQWREYHKKLLIDRGVPPEQAGEFMDGIDLSSWNAGQIDQTRRSNIQGIRPMGAMSDFVHDLRSNPQVFDRAANTQRAQKFINESRDAKKDLANALIEETIRRHGKFGSAAEEELEEAWATDFLKLSAISGNMVVGIAHAAPAAALGAAAGGAAALSPALTDPNNPNEEVVTGIPNPLLPILGGMAGGLGGAGLSYLRTLPPRAAKVAKPLKIANPILFAGSGAGIGAGLGIAGGMAANALAPSDDPDASPLTLPLAAGALGAAVGGGLGYAGHNAFTANVRRILSGETPNTKLPPMTENPKTITTALPMSVDPAKRKIDQQISDMMLQDKYKDPIGLQAGAQTKYPIGSQVTFKRTNGFSVSGTYKGVDDRGNHVIQDKGRVNYVAPDEIVE